MANSKRKSSYKAELRNPVQIIAILIIGGSCILGTINSLTSVNNTEVEVPFYIHDRNCKQNFTTKRLAGQIVHACNQVIKQYPKDVDALISRAQAYAVLGKYEDADIDFNDLVVISEIDVKDVKEFNSDDRRVAFLSAYWQEYMDFVKEKETTCKSADNAYKKPIEAYEYIIANSELNKYVEKEELLGILELGHFLSNREEDYPLATKLYDLILVIDNKSTNALLSLLHATLMGGDPGGVDDYIERINDLAPVDRTIKAKVHYLSGSSHARKGEYDQAINEYSTILNNYKPVLEDYPVLKFITERDKAFASFASGNKVGADFTSALSTLERLRDSDEIKDNEYQDRKSRIEKFQGNDNLLNSYIDDEFIFGHLIVHDFDDKKNAFIEDQHYRFYDCY